MARDKFTPSNVRIVGIPMKVRAQVINLNTAFVAQVIQAQFFASMIRNDENMKFNTKKELAEKVFELVDDLAEAMLNSSEPLKESAEMENAAKEKDNNVVF